MSSLAISRILSPPFFAAILLAAPLGAQTANYSVTDLGRLPGAYTTVPWGMNNQGAVVGWCQGPGTDARAFLWTPDGGITALPQFPGIVQNSAYAISDSGVIVGAGRTSLSGPLLPWRLMDGVLQAIPLLAVAPGARPHGVNDAGEVVGWTTDADPFHPVTHGFFWSDATGLIDITGVTGAANAINNQGVVVGSVAVGTAGQVFTWTLAGGMQIFAPLSGTCTDAAFAINDLGQFSCGNVCGGGSSTSSTGAQAYLYTPGSGMQHILPLAGSYTYGVDLNRFGDLVSTIRVGTSLHRPWIYTAQGGQQYLDTQIDPAAGYFMDKAFAIDDSGRIVGSASSSLFPFDGFPRAILLTPLTSPGTSFCFGDGTLTACPCGNSGSTGHGCENSSGTGGALLSRSGTASLSSDTLVLTSSGERPTAFSIYLQGNIAVEPVVYGDGLRCIAGTLKRLYWKSAAGGVVISPQAGDPSISARSAVLSDPIPMGATRYYQVYYRDSSMGFCPDPPGNTWNVSNALSAVWMP